MISISLVLFTSRCSTKASTCPCLQIDEAKANKMCPMKGRAEVTKAVNVSITRLLCAHQGQHSIKQAYCQVGLLQARQSRELFPLFGPGAVCISTGMPQGLWSSPGRILSPLLSPAAVLGSVTVPALCSWALQDAFPSIQSTCTAARLACLMPPGEGN